MNLKQRFSAVSEKASSGHYLDRLIAIAEAAELEPEELNLLRANRAYLQRFCKPAGLDDVMSDVTRTILHKANVAGLTTADIAPVAWGLDLEALREYGYVGARLIAKENA